MRRLAYGALAVVAALAALTVALAAWLLATESGLKAAWGIAGRMSPLDVQVGSLDGRLIGPLTLSSVTVGTSTWRVTAESVALDWRPLALLDGRLDVEWLRLAGVAAAPRPDAPAPPADRDRWRPPERLELPVDVNVERAEVERLVLHASADADPLVVNRAAMSARVDDDELLLHEIDIEGPLFAARGRVSVAPQGDYRSEAELDWVLHPPGRPDAVGSTLAFGSLESLTIRQTVAAPYGLEAEAVVRDVLDALRLDGRVALRPALGDIAPELPAQAAAVELSFAGRLDDLAVRGEAAAVLPDVVDAAVVVDARFLGDAVAVESLRITDRRSAAAVELAGRVELDEVPEVALAGSWSSLRWPPSGDALVTSRAGSLELSGTSEDFLIELDAALGAEGRVGGQVRRVDERLDVDLEWTALALPADAPRVVSERGALAVTGTLDDYSVSLNAALAPGGRTAAAAWAGGAAGHVRASGSGDRQGVDLERIDVAVLDGSAHGRAAFAVAPAPAATVDLAFERLDLGLVAPAWSGRVDGRVQAAARLEDAGPSVDVTTLTLTGMLRDRAVELDASGGYVPRSAEVSRLALRSGDSTISASGRIGPELDFEWSVDSPDLADLWPGLAGSLATSGSASGPLARPLVHVDVSAAGVEVDGAAVDALTLRASVDVAGRADSMLELDVQGAAVQGREVERLELRASGNAAAHTLAADVAGEGAELELAVAGGFDRPWAPDFVWHFELDRARAAYAELPAWTLEGRARGAVTAGGAELGEACWRSGDASLCLAATAVDGLTDARFALRDLPFGYFAAYLPPGGDVRGAFGATGELLLDGALPARADVRIETSRTRVGRTAADGSVPGLVFAPGGARVAWNGDRLEAELDLPLEGRPGGIDATGTVRRIDGEPLTASVVDAAVEAQIRDLGFLTDLVLGVAGTQGEVTMDVAIDGTIGAPRIVGRVELENGTARLREPGIQLEDVAVAIVGDGSGEIEIDGRARSGGGLLEAEGRLRLDGTQPVGVLRVRGEEFELFNTPDARVFASPDLTLDLSPARIELTGNVSMPRAEFTPREAIEGAVTASADEIVVDAEETSRVSLTRPFYARVGLALGDDVQFDGFGLTARLGGALEIVEVPGEPVTGSGELRVAEGTYQAYGQELEIRTGRLVFAGGALERPGLDIEAVRRPAEDILVGARVRGTLERPELSLFSEPAMPRQEQLSYLLLGRPLESTSTSEVSALSRAALALGLRGGNFVTGRLNEALGFDEFGIQAQPSDQSAASFVIGKYLTPSLYVSYGIGLFQPVNTLRLRYTISSRWRLVTESSTEARGGDLIYHIERGD